MQGFGQQIFQEPVPKNKWEKFWYYTGIIKSKTKLILWVGTTAIITVGFPLFFSVKI